MKNSQIVILAFLTLVLVSQLFGQVKDIISYLPSWKWQDRSGLVNPESIPYEKITIINYAFFIPLESGEIVGLEPEADEHLLNDLVDKSSGRSMPGTSLIDIAHNHNVKVMLSLGGWEDSGNFPQIAADPTKRARFAHECVKHIKNYGFDGIDVDWEYPGYAPHNGTPDDKQNFTLFLQAIRDSLDALSKITEVHIPLTAALSASATHAANIDITEVMEILDFINIMSYDFFGAWEPITNHNAPLYAPARGNTGANVDSTFRLYHETLGVAAEKINLGVPFYGRAYSGCAQLHSKHEGADSRIFGENGGATYYNIVKNMDLFTRHWDKKAQVPYLISESEKLFVSYDDEKSIGLKADYVLKNGARGLIIWQLMGDFFQNGDTPLLDVIYEKFHETEEN